jgi:hypothetical protein
MHRVLKTWMVEAGQPVVRPWLGEQPPTAAVGTAVAVDPAAG